MASILVVVPGSRERCGRLILLSSAGDTVSGPFRVLAKASRRIARKHGNPACARDLPFGDPPAGSYAITGSLPPDTVHRRPRRFGRLGALLLEPAFVDVDGGRPRRRVLALHGGVTDSAGRLYPTRGGLRLEDADLLTLLRAVNASQERGDPVSNLALVDVEEDVVPRSDDGIPGNRRRGSYEPALGHDGGGRHTLGGALGLTVLLGAFAGGAGGRARPMSRRRFAAAALLLVGGLGTAACDRSSPCDDDGDDAPSCPPRGQGQPDGGDGQGGGDAGDGAGGGTGDYSSGGGSG